MTLDSSSMEAERFESNVRTKTTFDDVNSVEETVFADDESMNEMYRKKIEAWRKLRNISNNINSLL